MHAFDTSIWEAEAGEILRRVNLVYRTSRRMARATERGRVFETTTKEYFRKTTQT